MENKKNNVASNILTGVSIASASVGLAVGLIQLFGMFSNIRAARRAAKEEQAASNEAE